MLPALLLLGSLPLLQGVLSSLPVFNGNSTSTLLPEPVCQPPSSNYSLLTRLPKIVPDDCQAAAQQLSSLPAIADNTTVLDGKSCVMKKQNGCLAFACNTADKKITTRQAIISGSSVQGEQQSVFDTGWIDNDVPSPVDCHQVIDLVSLHSKTGYFSVAHKSLLFVAGSCQLHVVNQAGGTVKVKEATLAWDLTAYVFNPCVVNGLYGYYFLDSSVIASIEPAGYDDHLGSDSVSAPDIFVEGSSSPDVVEPSSSSTLVPRGWQCSILNDIGVTGNIHLGSSQTSQVYRYGGCSGYIYNHYDNKAVDVAGYTMVGELLPYLMNTCVTVGQWGWYQDDFVHVELFSGAISPRGSSRRSHRNTKTLATRAEGSKEEKRDGDLELALVV
ncbi:hypothetical protein B0T26DRAFT_672484 [Lasiosphaeria miniovina]|uniref:Peptidase M15C domain-containing protein n=1 Tax=Lasiosphaeria miniovina TaxID=1954250 RepID=A0AA40B5R5_9PEZI|nr:uncharacterized protein B0T26DRAFT_672484 [Lasiosphaeria miniovina]KAK0727868.1 hypothetical protein B0T26DRAFT_672484 [Lasiosphaeria miniovina]